MLLNPLHVRVIISLPEYNFKLWLAGPSINSAQSTLSHILRRIEEKIGPIFIRIPNKKDIINFNSVGWKLYELCLDYEQSSNIFNNYLKTIYNEKT